MRRSILTIVCLMMMAAAVQAVTYSPYRGRGIYTTTGRLEHEHVSAPPAMSFVSTSAMNFTTTCTNRTAELSSGVSIVSVQLPAIQQHSRNVEAQAKWTETDNNSPGPRRVGPINPGADDVELPLGDAFCPMLLLALAYCLLRIYKPIRKKS